MVCVRACVRVSVFQIECLHKHFILQAIYIWLVVASALLLFVISAAYFV